MTKNYMVERMPFEDYLAEEGLNGSSLIHLRRSPMHYRFKCDNPQPPTPAMILGTATHRLILEPERVGDFAIWGEREEEKVRRGSVWAAFQAANYDKMIVTKKERDDMVGMATGARKNLPIRKYADGKGRCEVSMFWTDPGSGRRFKGRVDKIMDTGDVVFDLKTTRDCHPRKFGAQSYQLGYHIKMAMYWLGYKAITGNEPKMRLGAIDSKAPYESATYRVTKDVILQGFEEMDELLKTLRGCEDADFWPAAYDEETDLALPAWLGQEQDSLEEFAEVEE